MMEYVAIGLSFLTSVARRAGLPAPLCAGHLAIGSASAGRDFYVEGRTFENLGLAKHSPAGLNEMLYAAVSTLGRHA